MKPLHKRLSSARQLLIDWRTTLRMSGPVDDEERPRFNAEMARFDDAIKALAKARDAARSSTEQQPKDKP